MGAHGVVLGGGVAGVLAAAALATELDSVTVVERDRFDGDQPRAGAPQGRHAHLLLARGVHAMEELVPGVGEALASAGARRVRMPRDILTCTPFGWMPRFDGAQFLLSCRRPVLEAVLRKEVLADRVTVVEDTEAVGLVGDCGRVTGVVVRSRGGAVRELEADLVVDATGASSKADRWLRELGVPVRETVVDPGIRYATRFYRPGDRFPDDFPAVCVQPRPPAAGHGGVVLPVEDGQWIVSLAGLRGFVPPTDPDGFTAYARSLRHPLVADLIAAAEPVGAVRGYGAPPSRLRRFDRQPAGFVVVGDAAATFNPLYGHGMTVAALDAVAVRDGLRRHGVDAGLARWVQRRVARVTADAWALAVGQDTRYEGTTAPPRTPADRVAGWYADRVGAAAAVRPEVAAALLDAYTLAVPLSRLTRPGVVGRVLTARGRPADSPPLTEEERARL